MFREYLRSQISSAGFTTEDVLVSFLPLMRQVLETHQADRVAPLQGVDALHVDGGKLWFENSSRRAPKSNNKAIRRLDVESRSGVDVVDHYRRTLDVSTGEDQVDDLSVASEAGQSLERMMYLPGYEAWEHRVEHHDELTDVFSLGMILASLSCSLDFHDPNDLEQFTANRENLFRLSPGLHPVLAKAIDSMTELSRHRRASDLSRILHSLENYRSFDAGFEYDLKQAEEYATQDRAGKQQTILLKLQQRLFELSRRNRLLHFKPSMSFLDLTQSSVPLSFNVESIRPDQILTWGGKFAKKLLGRSPVCLNEYMNFVEVLYLGPTLDRIRTESLRDKAEYGFSQLKLSICFLRWADLKSSPPELYDSPLVLLPVKLTKKKGVRDRYMLEALSSEAEINPVVRYQFRQLYDIRLPEVVDLDEMSLDDLHASMAEQIGRSDQTVDLKKIERPRIDLLHDKARRRLDLYRRRARVSGRGVRKFMDIDYSYDPANFHPLGLQLFSTRITPAISRLREIMREQPSPRKFAVPETDPPVVEKERQFYSLRDHASDNPQHWEFDLCRVTLGNLKYRKMTLVRDYEELLSNEVRNDPFESSFSLTPPDSFDDVEPLELHERHQVVPCDPTQASAIALARTGRSYIIQGPPGTGKSQTITNLIADFVARGKRVLFVCEKRAAIDVVHQRLKQCGLDDLCCLIHDSQSDKKEFVMELKHASEQVNVEEKDGWRQKRKRLLEEFDLELAPLREYMEAARGVDDRAGIPAKDLLCRAVELRHGMPGLTAVEQEKLPVYSDWLSCRKELGRLLDHLHDVQKDGILANHPLAVLHPRVAEQSQPLEWVIQRIQKCDRLLPDVRDAIGKASLPSELMESMTSLLQAVAFAVKAQPVGSLGLYLLLDRGSDVSQRFDQKAAVWRKGCEALEEAESRTTHWRQKFALDEVEIALEQAKQFEGSILRFFKPAFWRLRKVMNSSYDFSQHAVQPSWSRVLGNLQAELSAQKICEQNQQDFVDGFRFTEGVEEFVSRIGQLREEAEGLSGAMRDWHDHLLAGDDVGSGLSGLASMKGSCDSLQALLGELFGDCRDAGLDTLSDQLMLVDESIDDLPDFLNCLKLLGELPESLATAFRTLRYSPNGIEAAIVRRTLEDVLRREVPLRRFDGSLQRRQVHRLGLLYDFWQRINASAVRGDALKGYRNQMRISSTPAAGLTDEEKQQKPSINRGRRELTHEFGKQMRYKPIRDLVAGESGILIRGLKPVWLMSPLSVSDTVPIDGDPFDVVIFDEASQITLEEAVPSLFRGKQAIVVGDEMQLPPTNFFSAKSGDDEDLFTFTDEDGETVEYDLSCNSFLNHAAKNLPSVMLGWHYRSRSESLISFSNSAFYQGRLLTVPDEDRHNRRLEEIVVRSAEDGGTFADEVLERAVSFHFIDGGVYENRRNRKEADYIAHLVRTLLRGEEHRSIGIVAFSEAQQDEIERALDRLAGEDDAFRSELEAEFEREDDGQFVGLLVKNLENIQGDERDVVIMSVCYGYNPEGQMRMNFGPINQSGGEKRLNVAFSRARHHMVLVSSIRYTDIKNDHNDGARCLKNYLRYASVCSVNDIDGTRLVLNELSVQRDGEDVRTSTGSHPVVRELKQWLEEKGYEVDLDVGLSHFRCDMAVRRTPGESYCVGILVDGERYYRQEDHLERDLLKPGLLQAFGWKLVHVFVKDFFEDSASVLKRLQDVLDGNEFDGDRSDGLEPYRQHVESMLAMEMSVDVPADDPGEPEESARDTIAKEKASGAGVEAELLVENTPKYFEFVSGSSRKFWEVTLSGNSFSVRFGRMGTDGQERTKSYSDPETARREAVRVMNSKIAKGYEEKDKS